MGKEKLAKLEQVISSPKFQITNLYNDLDLNFLSSINL